MVVQADHLNGMKGSYIFTAIYWVFRLSVQTVIYNLWVCFELPLKCDARCHSEFNLPVSVFTIHRMQDDLKGSVELRE